MHQIALVGEAYGEAEHRERVPFVGASGWHLTQMLNDAGIDRASCYLTNVFNRWPRDGKTDVFGYLNSPGKSSEVHAFCGPKADGIPGLPPLAASRYVRAEFEPELERLRNELLEVNPNVIIALGNTALWALTGHTAISKRRGTVSASTHCVAGFKLLPTYHPAAVMRQWELRAVTVLDLMKAKRESAFPEVIRPAREVWIEPDLTDLETFYERYLRGCSRLSVDIETAGTQITCIGFAPTPAVSLVVPFVDPRRARGSYWPSLEAELMAWRFVIRVLDLPCGKIFQNGLYDISFLWRSYGIRVRNPEDDTMLLHHALQPESPKALDFLGSVYTNEASWKLMRPRGKETIKRDE